MKLLLDENLPARLLKALEPDFLGSAHIRALGLASATDTEIWAFAKAEGFAILSKDSDFYYRSMAHGAPPKVIVLRVGNMSTGVLATFVTEQSAAVKRFLSDAEASALIL